jgi:hypothetical protein
LVRITIHHSFGKSTFEEEEFLVDGEDKQLRLFNRKGEEFYLRVPEFLESTNQLNNCKLVPLHSYLYDRESDIYKLQFQDKMLGYVFPTSVFYSETKTLKDHYRFQELLSSSFIKLLSSNLEIEYGGRLEDIQTISDLFPTFVIGVIFEEVDQEFSRFDIADFRFSLLQKGYTLLEWGWVGEPRPYPYDLPQRILEKNINLEKQLSSIASDDYVVKIYSHSLLHASSLLERFVLVYQIIELLMKQQFSINVDFNIIQFKDSKISKNTLRENLVEATKEKSLIASVLESACIKETEHSQFFFNYQELVKTLKIVPETDFRHAFYHFRNLIVHEYWKLHYMEELFRETMLGFEKIVEDILLKYDDVSFGQNIQVDMLSTAHEVKGELGNVSTTE